MEAAVGEGVDESGAGVGAEVGEAGSEGQGGAGGEVEVEGAGGNGEDGGVGVEEAVVADIGAEVVRATIHPAQEDNGGRVIRRRCGAGRGRVQVRGWGEADGLDGGGGGIGKRHCCREG